MKQLRILIILLATALGASGVLTSCIEDGISTSPSDQPAFSLEELDLGDLFTLGPSPTSRFTVYNRHDKGMMISSVRFVDDPDGHFRLNVDGVAGRDFSDIEIRAKDSIFVFVEATLPENGQDAPVDVTANIEFVVNGVASRIPVRASGQDVTRITGDYRIAASETLSATKPYQVMDSIVVDEGATLTIPAGARLYFHDSARMVVYGSLRVEGESGNPVTMTGDRSGFVAAQIPYEVMSGQWGGILFNPTSRANSISYASIRNSTYGLVLDNVPSADGQPALYLHNSVVRNAKEYLVSATNSDVTAIGCELADSGFGLLYLYGGNHTINRCTLANYYLFSAAMPALNLDHTGKGGEFDPDTEHPFLTADITNTIIYGNGKEISHWYFTGPEQTGVDNDIVGCQVFFRRCLFKPAGTDDDNYLNCLWDSDPEWNVDRNEYIFDYRPSPESPAATGADAALDPVPSAVACDLLGVPRPYGGAVGAYEPHTPDPAE